MTRSDSPNKGTLQLFLIALLLIPCVGIAWNPRGDLNVYYAVSKYLLEGKAATLYAENASLGNFFYGPLGLALLKPLALGSFATAHWVWATMNTVAYIVFWIFLIKLFPSLMERRARALFLIVWIASIKPIHASFQSFNVQLVCAAILVFAEWASHHPKKPWFEVCAGFLVTCLVAIKIFPAFVLLYYSMVKSRRLLAGVAAGAAFAILVPVLVFGFPLGLDLTRQFVVNLFTYHNAYPLAEGTYLLSLPSLMAWLGWMTGLEPLTSILTKLLVVGISLWFFATAYRSRNQMDLRLHWAMAMALMCFLNSVSRVDYFVFYVPAFAVLVERALEKPRLEKGPLSLLVLSLALIAFVNEWTLGSREWNHRLEGWRVPVYGMAILCGLLFAALKRENVKRL